MISICLHGVGSGVGAKYTDNKWFKIKQKNKRTSFLPGEGTKKSYLSLKWKIIFHCLPG